MRAVKNIFTFFFILALCFVSFALVVEYYYGDEIKAKLITSLGKKLNTRVDVKDATFSLLKKFPNATLELTDVMVEETLIKLQGDKDTLLFAERLFLQFNVIDIYTKNYNVNNIEIADGFILLHIDKDGESNYNFWKMAEDSLDLKKNVQVNLEDLVLDNIDIRYISEPNRQDFFFSVDQAHMEGEIARKNYLLNISAKLDVEWLKIGTINYVNKKNAELELVLQVAGPQYTINDGHVQIANVAFNTDGIVTYTSDNTVLDLKIDGKDLDIQSVVSILPKEYSNTIKEYHSSGKIYFNSVVKGVMSTRIDPLVTANFGISDGTISRLGTPQELEKVNLKGTFTNGDRHSIRSSTLNLTDCSFKIGNGNLKGNIRLQNLKYPRIKAELIGEIEMVKAKEFLGLDTLKVANGLININGILSGRIVDNPNGDGLKMINIKTEGTLDAKDVAIRMVGGKDLFKDINGKFIFKNNDLLVDNLQFKLADSDFELKGFFRNMAQYVLDKNAKLTIKADLHSHIIDLNYLLKNQKSESDTSYGLNLPPTVNLELNLKVDSIFFRRFHAQNLNGKVVMKNRIIDANPISLKTMGGDITLNGHLDGRNPNALITTCDAVIQEIDISQLFYQCENFKQTTLTNKNLKGLGTADIQFVGLWDSELNLDMDRATAESNIRIDDGELINYAPMLELSDYIDVNELKHIKFSRMENHIQVRNQNVHIPKTHIKCTAMHLNLEGDHTFDNHIDYRFNVELDELLSKKFKSKKGDTDYHEYDDGTRKGITIYITMQGTVDEPIIKQDKTATLKKIAKDIIEEKIGFKQLLKDEFNIFKKDTTLTYPEEKKEEPRDTKDDGWDMDFDAEEELED
ncbi:MAG: hypothetical protein HRT72_02335 [Flavobacteriales bacterium]|nr:hypothetical protein [Flavobacteriales bacterium]